MIVSGNSLKSTCECSVNVVNKDDSAGSVAENNRTISEFGLVINSLVEVALMTLETYQPCFMLNGDR